MVVTNIGSRLAEQIRMRVNSLQDASQYEEELDVFIGGITGLQQVHAVIGGDGPVVMFPGTVHTCIGFLM